MLKVDVSDAVWVREPDIDLVEDMVRVPETVRVAVPEDVGVPCWLDVIVTLPVVEIDLVLD